MMKVSRILGEFLRICDMNLFDLKNILQDI